MQKKIKVTEIPSKFKIVEQKKEEPKDSKLESELKESEPQLHSNTSNFSTPTLISNRIAESQANIPRQREKPKEEQRREISYEASGRSAQESYESPASTDQERASQFLPPSLALGSEPDESRNVFRGRSDFDRSSTNQRREYTTQTRNDHNLDKKKKRDWNF